MWWSKNSVASENFLSFNYTIRKYMSYIESLSHHSILAHHSNRTELTKSKEEDSLFPSLSRNPCGKEGGRLLETADTD